jgi:hypothetical protein
MKKEKEYEYLTLKWGTIKECHFNSIRAKKLLEKYNKLGSSYSVLLQKDCLKQKEIICKLIDLLPKNEVFLDWDDMKVTKAKAKKYVMNYDIDE